ncbi:MAG: protein kinase domain-containing protein [Candidatus Promineifilaceae bacterium]
MPQKDQAGMTRPAPDEEESSQRGRYTPTTSQMTGREWLYTSRGRGERVSIHDTEVADVDEPAQGSSSGFSTSDQSSTGNVAYIIRNERGQEIRRLSIEGGIVTRRPLAQSQLVLSQHEAEAVSASHAVLRFRQGRVEVRDLHSSYGTFHNGNRLLAGEFQLLNDNDIIRFGTQLEYRIDVRRRMLINERDGKRIDLREKLRYGENILITRLPQNDILIKDNRKISSPHLMIRPGGSNRYSIMLRRLADSNPILIDGKPLGTMKKGEYIGHQLVSFEIGGQFYEVEAERRLPLQTIDQYQIKKQIYGSRMAELFLAEHDDQKLVVKLLLSGQKREIDARKLFKQEAELMKALGSEEGHILRCIDEGFIREEDAPYIIMPHLDGLNLAQILYRIRVKSNQLSPGLALADIRAIMDAVIVATRQLHAHGIGYIHGDIKPGNVFIDRAGKVWLIDLGICTPFGHPGIFGTSHTSPPEVLSKERRQPVSAASDVYSLGALLFEMLAGRGVKYLFGNETRPFDEDETRPEDTHDAGDEYTPLGGSNPRKWLGNGYGRSFVEVIEKALQETPLNRYQDVTTFENALLAAYAKEKARQALASQPTANLAALAAL